MQHDWSGRTTRLDLRQTLWSHLLKNALVFETGDHIQRFRQALRAAKRVLPRWLRLYGLDGTRDNVSWGKQGERPRAYEVGRAPRRVWFKAGVEPGWDGRVRLGWGWVGLGVLGWERGCGGGQV